MNIGYDKPLYIQPFDHRGSFQTKKIHQWLTTAATVPGFIGFAVGRTVFWEPLVGWRDKKNTREEAVTEIARRYQKFVDVFEKARA